MRITCFATNTPDRPIAELDLRHRLRARTEDRIRAARATSLRNLALHTTAQNKVWLEIIQIALDLLAWMPMLALTGKIRLCEPRRLRFRLLSAAAQFVTTGRRRILRLTQHWPWTGEITAALERLALLPNPDWPATLHRPDDNITRPGQWNPAPTRRDNRAAGLPTISPEKRKGPPAPSTDPRERSRLRVVP